MSDKPNDTEPLTADELRLREALIHQSYAAQNCAPGSPLYDRVMSGCAYKIPDEPPMVPGRKLRDALLQAGYIDGMKITHDPDAANTGSAIKFREAQRRLNERMSSMADAIGAYQKPRRSFLRLIGSIAWRLLVVMVVVGATVFVLAGGRP